MDNATVEKTMKWVSAQLDARHQSTGLEGGLFEVAGLNVITSPTNKLWFIVVAQMTPNGAKMGNLLWSPNVVPADVIGKISPSWVTEKVGEEGLLKILAALIRHHHCNTDDAPAELMPLLL